MTNEIPMTVLKVSHHTVAHIAERYPYAGYGSNLMMRQIAERCPKADLMIGGTLLGYRLEFAPVATIVADDDSSVPVGVYRLRASDIATLDRKEGMGRVYDRYLVTVITDDSRALRCFTYIKRVLVLQPPTAEYYTKVQQGYRDWHFDDRRLRHARSRAEASWAASAPAREAAERGASKLVAKYQTTGRGPSAGEYWAQGDMLEPIDPQRERPGNVVPFAPAPKRFVTVKMSAIEWGTKDDVMYFRVKGSRTWYRDVSMPDQISRGLVLGELASNLPGAQAYRPHQPKEGKQ